MGVFFMLKKAFAFFLCLMLLCASAYADALVQKWPQTGEPFGEDVETMRVIVMGIGAKDSFLIQCGGENMLIDSGTYSAGEKVYQRLVALGVDHLDYAVNTHPHDDHIDGFLYLYEKGIQIDKFYTAFPLDYDERQKKVLNTARAHDSEIISIKADTDLSFGGNRITWFQYPSSNTNHHSLITRVALGDRAIIMLSDVGRGVHDWLVKEHKSEIGAEIVKLPHHGIYQPKKAMIQAINPELCIITNGENSASEKTVRYVKSWKLPILFTTRGDIEMVTDGQTWYARQYDIVSTANVKK